MELLNFENLDLENNFVEVLFDGILKEGFYVETEFDYNSEVVEEPEEFNNFTKTYHAENISFWEFKIFNSDEEKISVNDRELKKIKQLIEFKLIDSLNDYINKN